MAARKNLPHSELTRQRIKTSMLLNRLQGLVNGEVEMPPHAVTAALGLLKKVVPDLQSVQVTGADGGPVQLERVTRRIVDPGNG